MAQPLGKGEKDALIERIVKALTEPALEPKPHVPSPRVRVGQPDGLAAMASALFGKPERDPEDRSF